MSGFLSPDPRAPADQTDAAAATRCPQWVSRYVFLACAAGRHDAKAHPATFTVKPPSGHLVYAAPRTRPGSCRLVVPRACRLYPGRAVESPGAYRLTERPVHLVPASPSSARRRALAPRRLSRASLPPPWASARSSRRSRWRCCSPAATVTTTPSRWRVDSAERPMAGGEPSIVAESRGPVPPPPRAPPHPGGSRRSRRQALHHGRAPGGSRRGGGEGYTGSRQRDGVIAQTDRPAFGKPSVFGESLTQGALALSPRARLAIHRADEAWARGTPPGEETFDACPSSPSSAVIPSPRPIRRQFARSAGLPLAKRGNQASGTLTLRPSTRSTRNASSVTSTFCAWTGLISVAEELIPGFE